MAELVPLPLPLLLRRAFRESRSEGKIFDLPRSQFFRGFADLDLSVDFHGHRASTPLGPAAGPHGQLAQNIALSWLGGSRIIELKTVQILDELKIPRPCIDVANVGYNVEWSQELKLEQSLDEYVKAAMLLEILKASKLAGDDIPGDTVLDMSVGYNLEGIRSPQVRGWIASMLNAGKTVEKLRGQLAGEFDEYRDLPFPTCISDTVSLSTFHGCPANEIEGIATFLLAEMGCHLCIKLNPTLLGYGAVDHLLHDVLGYQDIRLHPQAFDDDLQFDQALDLIPRLQALARANGRSLSVKFTNTLVVKNHKAVFADEVMYLSGAPLHVLALNLAKEFRARLRAPLPMSFSGGMDANNVARVVALGFVPATTCTDLLRPGGYGRLIRYLNNLAEAMRARGAKTIAEFTAGPWPDLVAEATADARYRFERNSSTPRKIGSHLSLYDCVACDKCVPVCPNDANFVYETEPVERPYENYELSEAGARAIPGGVFRIAKAKQFANFADACNECGNCDVHCPEDGSPFLRKPRFFGSLETFARDAGGNGFFIDHAKRAIHGAIDGTQYRLTEEAGGVIFEEGGNTIELRDHRPVSWTLSGTLDLLPYFKMKLLLDAVSDRRHANFVNAMEPHGN